MTFDIQYFAPSGSNCDNPKRGKIFLIDPDFFLIIDAQGKKSLWARGCHMDCSSNSAFSDKLKIYNAISMWQADSAIQGFAA